jgi:tRNA dimethylallyltransferase
MTLSNTCIVLCGPTAVGKTSWSLRLAMHYGTEIISADSRQCFGELNIGVAKSSPGELQLVKHYFINSHSIQQDVNVSLFENYALEASEQIFSRHSKAIMVGGTGLYIKAFCEGLDELPEVDIKIREKVRAGYMNHGLDWLRDSLKQEDPLFYDEGEILNPQRMMRALEVKRSSGKSILEFHSGLLKPRPFRTIKIGFELPMEELYQNITDRVDSMMAGGLVEEVESLQKYRELNALQTVGYKEIFKFLDGAISLEQAVSEIKKNTRQYARRQLTWFRKDPSINWFNPNVEMDKILHVIEDRMGTTGRKQGY